MALVVGSVAVHADVFVSPNGSDDNPGTRDKPFATLERARDAVREMRRSGALPKDGVTVWLRGGDHARTTVLELTAEDSGTAEAPIVWRGYGGERARVIGGRVISGFQPVEDDSVRARLAPQARNHVLVADLRAQGIQDYGEPRSRGFARPTAPAHGELFFGGMPMTVARWPNTGDWEHIAGFPEEGGVDDGHGTNMGALPAGFFYEGDRPSRWENADDIWVHGYWAYDWANSYERIAELDPVRRLVRTAEPHGNYGFIKKQRFHFLNILEELDEPGEWFLDRRTGMIYFWPPAPIASGEVLFSLLEQPLVRLTDASHVELRGIVFEATRGNAIEITGGEGNSVAGCLLRNIGNWAVIINGGTNHSVRGCDVWDTGDGGVSMSGGDRRTLAPGNHVVENCHFQRQGRWSKCYVPAVSMNGVGLRASHNLIHDHPHAAILFGGNDHLIEFNDIHHIALETGDVGAIYAGRDYTIRGNRIRRNYIHETGGVGMGSMGVYMDDCVSGTEVFGNVFYKVHWAMFIGGGRDHRVENNLFVDCDPAVRADARGLDRSPVWRNMVDKTMRDRLNAVPLELYRERYPELKTLDAYYGPPGGEPIVGDAFTGIPPEGNVIARNVCIGAWKEITWHADKKTFDIQDNFVTDDMGQVGGPKTGFKLPADSPAWENGFKPIPFDEIGLRPDADRERLARMHGTLHRAAWMAEGTYGVMTHYLIAPPGSSAEERTAAFNGTVAAFDLDFFLRQFEDSRADWLIFTIGQNTGYYCGPNAFLDRVAPGHTSERNLVLELAERVQKLGKRFIAYLPAEVAGQSDEIKRAFGWDESDQSAFLRNYLEFVRAYATVLGRTCDGWWFDGCYDPIHKGAWNWQDWSDAARLGNPDAVIAFNDGAFCVGREKPVSPLQDYHAGEVHMLEESRIRFDFMTPAKDVYRNEDGYLRVRGKAPVYYMPTSQFVDGVQWHALVPIDSSFMAPVIPDQHYEDGALLKFLMDCKAVRGAVTLNVPIDTSNGHIPAATAAQIKRLGEALVQESR